MNEPFNTQVPHFLTKVKAYCAKVLPLVFDNSLSYYEFLCQMSHKLNETIAALNAQNLNIIEFTHMIQLEIEKFEKYVDERMTNFENEIKKQWEEYKALINAAFEEFKNQMRTEWEQEKEINKTFRENLLTEFNTLKSDIITEQERFENKIKGDFETFKNTVNNEIEQFEQSTNADLTTFKNTMQTQQNEFEGHMIELFTDFTTDENKARTDFESNFQQLFEQWKVGTLNALNTAISQWENDAYADLNTAITNHINTLNTKIADLQTQINQMTPEGAIKADNPDSNGNSQLYKIDNNGERVNIMPTTSTNTNTNAIRPLKNWNSTYSATVGDIQFQVDLNKIVIKDGGVGVHTAGTYEIGAIGRFKISDFNPTTGLTDNELLEWVKNHIIISTYDECNTWNYDDHYPVNYKLYIGRVVKDDYFATIYGGIILHETGERKTLISPIHDLIIHMQFLAV